MNTEQHSLVYQNVTIPYTVKRSARRRKGMAIGITQSGVSVAVPVRTPQHHIKQLVTRHAAWIIKKLAQIHANKSMAPSTAWETGDTIYYLGKPVPLTIIQSLLPDPGFFFGEHFFELYLPHDLIKSQQSSAIRHFLISWYKKKAHALLAKRVIFYQDLLGVKYQKLTIANQKTQWGSCDRKGNLRLNWRLILLSLPLIDYVVVHELCHIVHLNHSDAFWRLVKKIIPDYVIKRKQLNECTSVFLW